MSGDRGVTRSVTGATRVLGLLSLLSLANCMMEDRDTLDQIKEAIGNLGQKADAVKERFESTRNIPLEIMEKTEQYINSVQVILEGDSEFDEIFMPMFRDVRSMFLSVKETLIMADGNQEKMLQDIEMNIERMKNEMIKYFEDFQEKQ